MITWDGGEAVPEVFHDVVRLEIEATTAVITIAHPPANAISGAVLAGIGDALDAAEADPQVRAAILTGEGDRFFAAGADIKEFSADTAQSIARGQELTLRMEASPLPLIAAVNGMAFGGGCELALACDIRIASSTARFGQPEINLGIIPGWGGTQRLPRTIGRGPAMELLLTGDPIDAERAHSLGLVSRVVAAGDLLGTAREMAGTIASRAPLALAATKRAVQEGIGKDMAAALEAERREFVALFGTDDAAEGIAAFVGKRAPEWRGR